MRFTMLGLLLLILLCFTGEILPSPLAISAQPPAFDEPSALRVWLFDRANRTMLLVGNGEVFETFELPLNSGATQIISDTAVSGDGTYFTYLGADDSGQNTRFFIYNRPQDRLVASYAPPGMLTSGLILNTEGIYNPASTSVVLSYTLNNNTWEITVINLNGFNVDHVLRSGTPAAEGIEAGGGIIPTPRQFTGDDKIGFTMVKTGVPPEGAYAGYVWDLTTNEVRPDAGFVSQELDVWRDTGEIVMPLPDERFAFSDAPNADISFPYWQSNTLQAYQPQTGERFPFVHDAAVTFGSPEFVKGGSLIMTRVFNGSEYARIFYDRAGQQIATMPATGLTAEGTYGGFIFLRYDQPFWSLIHIQIPDDLSTPPPWPQTLLWSDELMTSMSIAQVRYEEVAPPPVSPPFADWGRLAAAADTVPTAEIAFETPDQLAAGGLATVRTTDGDRLNVRTGAGVDFAIIERLERGAIVTVIEGPVQASTFTWWKIRTSSGKEGWAVEFADNEQTLVPGTSPVTGGGALDEREAGGGDRTVDSRLRVGDDVEVTLTQGSDALRLRNGAGLDFRVVTMLPDGTRLSVIGGPVEADNFIWWELRTPEGNTGFAAEIIGRERVLTKPGEVTATAVPDVLAVPTLIEPQEGAAVIGTGKNVLFAWSNITAATQYTLELSYCAVECTGEHLITTPFTSTTVPLEKAGTYRWRVSTQRGSQSSPFSEWVTFTVQTGVNGALPAPQLVSPANDTTFDIFPRKMDLQWQSVNGAARYMVEIEYCVNDGVNCVAYAPVMVDSTTYSFNFIGAQPGRWRVSSVGGDGVTGPASEWWTFRHLK